MSFKLVNEHICILTDDIIVNNLLNEGFIDNIKSSINKLGDKKAALSNLIKRFNSEANTHNKKRLAKIIVVLFLTTYAGSKLYQSITNDSAKQDNIANTIADDKETSLDKIVHYFKELINGKELKQEVKQVEAPKFNDASIYKTSDVAKDTIKHYEKLRLKGYKIKGDGKITIGWGHAEPIRKSKYKVGQLITKEQANALFEIDIKKAEDGVKRIFGQWKEKGNDVQITQGMFDAMVSIAFNAGVDGLRVSSFIQQVKRKKFAEAAKEIINVSNTGKFRGLNIRRGSEENLFKM